MKFAKSISRLLLLLVTSVTVLASLSGCAGAGIVSDVDPCVEIPFVDGAEGACTNTIKHKPYLVNATDWAKLRPTLIMLRASDWTKIKLDWMKQCRMPGVPKTCEVALNSVDSAITALNSMVKQIVKP